MGCYSITMYYLVYVDYILLTGTSPTLIHKRINFLHATFSLKKLGKPMYYLGIEIKHLRTSCLLLTHTKYI